MNKKIAFEKLSIYRSADQSPGFLLWRVHAVWRRQIEAALAEHDLTHIQFVLLAGLAYLTKDGAAVTQNDVAALTHCDVTMTSQVLRGLEKKGLITRTTRATDERAKYPAVTPQGLKTLKGAMKDVEAVDENFFSTLGSSKQNFIENLQRLLS